MGYAECDIIMESKRAFCPRSSTKLTQSIIKDHMLSHYKKVYSAKAAIDASVPKSLIYSVKYNDQIRREQLRKGGRPQSAHSLSQRNSRTSCSSAQSRRSVQGEESPYFCSGSSMISSPRPSTSFHVKQIVYPSCTIGDSLRHSHPTRCTSELNYRSPDATSHRQQAACYTATSGTQSGYKSFQDPAQKTYSGDLIQKHSQYFTEDKPFTPRTLKSDKGSYLSKYRYYTSPQRKPNQDGINPRLMRQETYHGRVSPEGRKSPIMMSVSAEEEELMYLEFIAEVTDDILSRGHFSDRVLDRVVKRHIEMNKHRLDEDKMLHLLEVLRNDFKDPANMPISSANLDLLHIHLPRLESRGSEQMEPKEDNDLLPYASLIQYGDSPVNAASLSVSTPLHSRSPERSASLTETHKEGSEDLSQKKHIGSPLLSESVSENAGTTEEDDHQNQKDTTVTDKEGITQNHEYTIMTNDEGLHLDQAEDNNDELSKDLEDLGRRLSESLHVSSNTPNNQQATTEQHMNTFVSLSDDEF
ncbi:spermatogenesis-associated protein 7 homolog [Diretmus argenteus]